MISKCEQIECPKCHRPDYQVGRKFHWSGSETKQCSVCGHDLPDDICTSCFAKRKPFIGPKTLSQCQICGREMKIKLPHPYKIGSKNWELLGWEEGDSETGRIVIKLSTNETKFILTEDCSFEILSQIGVDPKQIPSKRSETISSRDWERFQRFLSRSREIEDLSDETLYNWKLHLEWLGQEFSFTDADNEMEDIDSSLRRIPRLMKYVRTGQYPPDDMNDEDMTYYDDSVINYKTKVRKVVVKIVEIGNGEL